MRLISIVVSISLAFAGFSLAEEAVASKKTVQTISFEVPKRLSPNSTPVQLMAKSSSGLGIKFSSNSPPNVCSVTDGLLVPVGAGICKVQARQEGNNKFKAVMRSINVRISKLPQSLQISQTGQIAIGEEGQKVRATTTSGLSPLIRSSSDVGICSVIDGVIFANGVGVCTLHISQPGDSTYKKAKELVIRLSIVSKLEAEDRKPQTIMFRTPESLQISQSPYNLSATASSGLSIFYYTSTPDVCRISRSSLIVLAGGVCLVSAAQDGSKEYAAAKEVTREIAIRKSSQQLSFEGPIVLSISQSPFVLRASSSSGLPVSFSSTTTGVCYPVGGNLIIVASGSCTVTASQQGNSAFEPATPRTTTFEVRKAAQTVSFIGPEALKSGQLPYTLTASSSSGLPVTFASSTPSVCTVRDRVLSFVSPGICRVAASQAGDSAFAPANEVIASIEVTSDDPSTAGTMSVLPSLSGSLVFGEPLTFNWGSGISKGWYVSKRIVSSCVELSCGTISTNGLMVWGESLLGRSLQLGVEISSPGCADQDKTTPCSTQRFFSARSAPVVMAPRPELETLPTYTSQSSHGSVMVGSAVVQIGSWVAFPTPSLSYQWFSCDLAINNTTASKPEDCVSISGATSSSFIPTQAEAGKFLSVRVSASNSAGTTIRYSRSLSQVGNPISLASGSNISGTPSVDETLSVGPGAWSGTPPITIGYYWFACTESVAEGYESRNYLPRESHCTYIPNAISSTFIATSAQIGKYLMVRIHAWNSLQQYSGEYFYTQTSQAVTP